MLQIYKRKQSCAYSTAFIYKSILTGALLLSVFSSEPWAKSNSEFNANVLSLEKEMAQRKVAGVSSGHTPKSKTRRSQRNNNIHKSPGSNYARSFRANKAISVRKGSVAQRGAAFIKDHSKAFTKQTNSNNFTLKHKIDNDKLGMSHLRYQQQINNIPVTGSYFKVHLNAEGVMAASSSLISQEMTSFNSNPQISTSNASQTARDFINQMLPGHFEPTTYSIPRLEIYSTEVIGDLSKPNVNRLVWYIEAKSSVIRYAIWVDANNGKVFNSFNKITEAKNRLTYDSQNQQNKRKVLLLTEYSELNSNYSDANNAHKYAGDTYDYFWTVHGRDSYDDLGSDVISNIRYCIEGLEGYYPDQCPFLNAFWDGDEMIFGEGYATDDLVGHEFTHGVIESSADLFYAYQSGALNESYADIFGEIIDLSNDSEQRPSETTSLDRWLIGEDIGAIRNMLNPTEFGQPGKLSDDLYSCSGYDNGGVHTNSGVANHAFALMVDGGKYLGTNINGIGLTKAAKIHYRALTIYLGPSSVFTDNYIALNQSCDDLIGSDGISIDDCNEVTKALDLVEMNATPCLTSESNQSDVNLNQTNFATCPAGAESQLFFDDFESINSSNWSISADSNFCAWEGHQGASNIYNSNNPFSGNYSLYGINPNTTSGSNVEMSNSILLPPRSFLTFEHQFHFEQHYDGGVIEYSVDHGNSWHDAGSLIVAGEGYNDIIVDDNPNNPLQGRNAYTGYKGNYSTTKLDLSSLAGSVFRLRFKIGSDNLIGLDQGYAGWFIDNVEIMQCKQEQTICDFHQITAKNGSVITVCL